MIIGLYGISGVGKTSLCKEIERISPLFKLIDSSVFMDKIIPGGIEMFKKMSPPDKYRYREMVIREIDRRYRGETFHTIIAGHYCFLKSDGSYEVAWTNADSEVYDMFFCIRSEVAVLQKQRSCDNSKNRKCFSNDELEKWQENEIKGLAFECSKRGTPFLTLTSGELGLRVMGFFKHFSGNYISEVCKELLFNESKTFAVYDCDGTLYPGDCLDFAKSHDDIDRNKVSSIFQRSDKYCFESFFEVAKYYSTIRDKDMNSFLDRCVQNISIHPIILKTLHENAKDKTVVWITSGFREIWEQVASRYGLTPRVVGGNNLVHSATIVSNQEKELFVKTLKSASAEVTVYGDSMVDAEMLALADNPYVVVSRKERADLFNYLKDHPNLRVIDIRDNQN